MGIRLPRYFGFVSGLSALGCGLLLSACAIQGPNTTMASAPAAAPDIPPRIRAEEITGRWGLAAYHKEADRPRTEAAARNQCKQPVVISMGPTGGVMMYPPDSSKLEELRMKGAPGNRTYIGAADEPAGTGSDREVLSFDGRVMITKFPDPEINGRYGTSVYVRCAPRA
ncbi:MAG TPA: hypothetical protein VJL90_12405 [Pseudorhodoplanes sp.]|nr:hypothetical protein [Pseudorhodoplanes sp.]